MTLLPARADDADNAVAGLVGIWLLLLIATAVVFIIWLWRCAKDSELLGRENPRFRAGWTIGSWFIPLANFVIPVLIVQDLWRASTPRSTPGSSWRSEKGSSLVGWWWALFVAASLVSRAGSGFDDDTIDGLRSSDQAALSGYLVLAVAAFLAIRVVIQLTRRFNDRRAEAALS